MTNVIDGGEAIMEAFRALGVDYVISSPGSEWAALWEALARAKINATPGPTYIDCGHENLAVNIALGYTLMTGRMQAVVLHAGTGLLQGSMAIHGAMVNEVPMIVMSGESTTYGEDTEFEPGVQWIRNLSVVGGPQKMIEPLVKWGNIASSIHTLYQQTVRAGEIAQRTPMGPTYMCMSMETMMEPWSPPTKQRKIDAAPKVEATQADIDKVATLIRNAKRPIITTEAAGRDPDGFKALVELAELMGIPVVEGRGTNFANFPKDHPLYLGTGAGPSIKEADLVLVVASRVPFYPTRNAPPNAEVVVISDNPHKAYMVYQNLAADHYLEGDVASSLRRLTKALADGGTKASDHASRRAHWQAEHDKLAAKQREAEAKAPASGLVDPLYLCAVMRELMPGNAIYIDETIVYGAIVQQHMPFNTPQSFFRTPTGLGQSLGLALGIKLAAREQPVTVLTGDGAFLYNPVLAALGASKTNDLPLLVILFNNHEYKSMKRNHLEHYPQGLGKQTGIHHGVQVDGFDFAGLGGLFGGIGRNVEKAEDLRAALTDAIAAVRSGKMAILNVQMSR